MNRGIALADVENYLNTKARNYDPDAKGDEYPVHNVTVHSFYLGETVVTQALWKAVMMNNPSKFKGENLPVEQMSWNGCQVFIRKLNQWRQHSCCEDEVTQ